MQHYAQPAWIAGRYELQHNLAASGSRRVWRAFDHLLHRPVVIKGSLEGGAREILDEYLRLRRCAHPRVARAFDLEKTRMAGHSQLSSVFQFFTQEWIEGPSLQRLRGQLEVEGLERLLRETLEVVAFLHHLNLTRLDLKPAHLLQTGAGWRLIDLDQARPDRPLDPGALHGTLAYAAPEVLSGAQAGPQADLYSVGAVLFEAMTGSPPPLEGSTLPEIARRLTASAIPPLPAEWVSRAPRLAALTRALLARAAADRPRSADEALEMLAVPDIEGTATRPLSGPSARPLSGPSARTGSRTTPSARRWQLSCPMPVGPMLHREDSLEAVGERWAAAGTERGGGVVVQAPPRGGRSRFLAELCASWQAGGRPAILLRGGEPPHGTLEAAGVLLGHLQATAGVPLEVEPHVPAPAPGGSPEEAREACVRQYLDRMRRAGVQASARAGGLIPILVDDPDRLDDLSRAILLRLAQFLPDSGLFLVLACPLPERALEGAAARSSLVPGLTPVDLPALTAGQIRSLAETLLGPGGIETQDELDRLAASTEGRPGWVRDALSLRWVDPGASISGWSPRDGAPGALALIDALPADAAAAARAASVFDQPFTAQLLSAVLEAPAGSSLATLLEAGLLRQEADPEGEESRLRFAREALRRALERSLEPGLRRSLHGRAAAALERQAMIDRRIRPARIAHHLVAAGEPARATLYLQRAAEDAIHALCFTEAAEALRTLIDVTDPRAPHRAELYRQLGEVLIGLGQNAAAREALEAALQLPDGLSPVRRARAMADLGRVLSQLGDFWQARSRLEEALAGAQALGVLPSSLRTAWWQHLTWVYLEIGELDRAREALRFAEREGLHGGTRLDVDQAHLEASLALRTGGVGEALHRGDVPPALGQPLLDALALARQLGHAQGEMKLLNCLVKVSQLRGDALATRQYLEATIQRTREAFDLLREGTAVHNLGEWLKERRELRQAHDQFVLAARLHHRLGNPVRELKNRVGLMELLLEGGNLQRAATELTRLHELIDAAGEVPRPHRLACDLLALRLRLKQGDHEGLDQAMQALQTELETCRPASLWLEAHADRIELALARGQHREVIRLYGALVDRTPVEGEKAIWHRIHRALQEVHRRLDPLAGAPDRIDPDASGEPDPPSATGASSPALVLATPLETPPSATTLPPAHRSSSGEGVGATSVRRADADDAVCAPPGGDSPRTGLAQGGNAPAGGAMLEWLEGVSRLVEVADEYDALAAELAALAGRLLSGRGLVFLFDGTRPQAVRSFRMQDHQVDDISRTIIDRVRTRREPYICPDIHADRELGQLRSLRDADVASVICFPVLQDNACLGVVYVDHAESGRVSGDGAVAVVARIAALTRDLLATHLRRRQRVESDMVHFGLVGQSPPMLELKRQLKRLAGSTASDLVVLLLGETGTGKSVIAHALHANGPRKEGPFVPVNSAAIPESLFESLMYGHLKGTFTGALEQRPGWFEMAEGGTLFLDEIGEMPLAQQAGLLETLGGRRQYRRLGDSRDQELDIHLICATSRNLIEEVAAGRFRRELLRRIQVNSITIPPLRERGPEDIRLLASHMIHGYLASQGLRSGEGPMTALEDHFTRQAQDLLYAHRWPWNVAELENLFRNEGIRATLRTLGEEKVGYREVESALSLESGGPKGGGGNAAGGGGSLWLPTGLSYKEFARWTEELREQYVTAVYRECDDNATEAARKLGCSRDVVYKYLAPGLRKKSN